MQGKRWVLLILCLVLGGALIFFAMLRVLSVHVENAVLEAVGDYTQQTITVEGHFKFKPRFLPIIAIRKVVLNGVNKDDHHLSLPFLKTGKLLLVTTWRSLFSEIPQLRAIRAKNVELNIVDLGKGHPIWAMLLDQTSPEFSAEDRMVLQNIQLISLKNVHFNYINQYKEAHHYTFSSVKITHKGKQWSMHVKGKHRGQPLSIILRGSFDKEKERWLIHAIAKVLDNTVTLQGTLHPNFYRPDFDGDITAEGQELAQLLSLIDYEFDPAGAFQIKSQLKVNDKLYQFNALSLQFNGTQLKGDLRLPREHSREYMKANVHIDTKDAGKFLRLFGISDSFEKGHLRALANVRSAVDSKAAFVSHLSGRVALDIDNLRYKGIKALASQQKGQALYRAASAGSNQQDMLLQCFIGSFSINKGMAQTGGFVLKTPAILVVGKGRINLRNQGLDLELKPKSGEIIIPGIPAGVRLGGTLSHPRVTATLSKAGVMQVIFGVATGGIGFAAFAGLDILKSAGSGPTTMNQCRDFIQSRVPPKP